MASQSTLLGAAGEHFVMSELLRRGYIAALAPAGVPNADIVVTDIEGQRLCSIQVKARRDIGSDGGWHMKSKHESARGKRLFYCFVDFGRTPGDRPKVFVIPSTIIADALQQSHQKWLATLGAKGQKRKDTAMRRLLPDYTRVFGKDGINRYSSGWMEKFLDAWQELGLQAAQSEAQ